MVRNNSDLANGEKKPEKRVQEGFTFWKMWTDDLPGNFPKRKFTDEFEWRWEVTYTSVLKRLKEEDLKFMRSDLRYMYENYGIGFDFMGNGFFLDKAQYEIIQDRELMESAKIYGMTKAVY